MRYLSRLLAATLLLGSSSAALADSSTINPNIPAQGSALSSAPIRGNFASAANDINRIFGYFSAIPNNSLYCGGPSSVPVACTAVSIPGPLTINPTPGTINQGLVINQTGPSSGGPISGPLIYNLINVTSQAEVVVGAVSEDPLFTKSARGVQIQFTTGGTNVKGLQEALVVRLDHTIGPSSNLGIADFVAFVSLANSDKPGINGLYAGDLVAWAGPTAAHDTLGALEVESFIDPTATIGVRTGVRAITHGVTQNTLALGAAFSAHAVDSGAGAWKQFISLNGMSGQAQAVLTTGDFATVMQPMMLANIFNMSNVTVTGSILSFPNAQLTGSGVLTLRAQGSLPAPPVNTAIHASFGNSVVTQIVADSFGNSVGGFFHARSARGTHASQSASQFNDTFGGLLGSGYGTTGYASTSKVSIIFLAGENWTNTAQGTYMDFSTTTNGTTTESLRFRINTDGGLTSAGISGGSKGIGTINISKFFKAGVEIPTQETNNTWTGLQTVTNATSVAEQLTLVSTQADALRGPVFVLDRNSASPANSDVLGLMFFRGRNSAAAVINYADIFVSVTNVTAASETASIVFDTFQAGAVGTRVVIGAGVGVGTTAPGTAGILNVLTGLRIGGAAASGNVLRGNGTNFISAVLAASDLSNGVTGSGSVVLATSPSLVTPALGVATATSLNVGGGGAINSGILGQLSSNVTALPAPTLSGSLFHLANADGIATRMTMDAFGSNSSIGFRRANGSNASKTAIADGNFLGVFQFEGYFVTGGPGYSAAPSFFGGKATQAWTSTAQGVQIEFWATPNNTASSVHSLTVGPNHGAITAGMTKAIPAGGTAGSGYMFSSTANFGVFYGSGAPTLSAAQGSIYLRSDGAINARLYINTDGGTTWTAFNTAS